ncbi:MAG: radical SAM protein [Oscillospiraceae bacterium]|nr:radical SAM protein [Oscillospiraceae bacterium]
MSARKTIYPVFVPHLGCPYACVFCNQREITGREASEAMEELNELFRRGSGDAELAFYGGSFTAIPPREQECYLEKAARLMESGVITSIRLSTRPDAVDGETISRLKEYGVQTVELGAQSMCDRVLLTSGRGHCAQDVRDASVLIKRAGLKLVLQMMTGLPGDDEAGAEYTARELCRLGPDAVRIYPTVVVRGTQLEKLWRDGLYREHTVEEAVTTCAKILPIFEAEGIPVIRLGLNPTKELSEGAALAGAYHPALGELVRSRMLRNQAEKLLIDSGCEGKTVRIMTPPQIFSQMIGQKKCNLSWLTERFSLHDISVRSVQGLQDIEIKILQTEP